MTGNNGKENGLIAKWGNEVFDDGVMNAPQCIARYGYRFLNGGELSFVMCLMSYKYDNRNPFPSQEQLAKDMGVGSTQIERWIDGLFNKKGLINIYERRLPDGTRTSNEYDFSPLLEKCLEESRKEKEKTEPKIKKTKRERSTKQAEKNVENIPPTFCGDSDEIYPPQNVGMVTTKCRDGSQQNVGMGIPQNVGTNKESEEGKFEEGNFNNVCIEEQRVLELIKSREDLNTHTHQLMILFTKLSKRKNFNHDVFLQTLEIINLDVYDMNYLKAALNNNLKKGFVKDFSIKPKQPQSVRKEVLPDWFNEDTKEREPKKESKPKYTEEELAAKQKEIADMLANI